MPSSEAELPNFLNLADMVWNNSGRDIPQFLCVRVRVPAFNSRAPAFNSCAHPRPLWETPRNTFENTGPCLQKSSNVSAGVFRELVNIVSLSKGQFENTRDTQQGTHRPFNTHPPST